LERNKNVEKGKEKGYTVNNISNIHNIHNKQHQHPQNNKNSSNNSNQPHTKGAARNINYLSLPTSPSYKSKATQNPKKRTNIRIQQLKS